VTPLRRLQVAAAVETVTVLLLFGNLLTVHASGVAALAGPVHGMAYLTVIVLAVSTPGLSTRAKWLSAVPLVGGWLSVRSAQSSDCTPASS
jgi:hypothetical protein